MGCASGTMKCLLNTVNLLILLCGIAFIAMASFLLHSAPTALIIILYVTGAIQVLAALLGCCGICNENICLTALYAILIATSLAFQIYNKIKPIDTNEIKKFASDHVLKAWNEVPQEQIEMDKIQQIYHCCGANGPADYYSKGLSVVPPSCYKDNHINLIDIYSIGCVKATEDLFLDTLKYVKVGEWVCIGITAVMLLFSIYLIFRFRNKQDHYRY